MKNYGDNMFPDESLETNDFEMDKHYEDMIIESQHHKKVSRLIEEKLENQWLQHELEDFADFDLDDEDEFDWKNQSSSVK